MDLLVLVWPPLQTAVSSSSRMSGANRRTAVTRGSMVAARRDALRPNSRQSRLISRADNRDDWPRAVECARVGCRYLAVDSNFQTRRCQRRLRGGSGKKKIDESRKARRPAGIDRWAKARRVLAGAPPHAPRRAPSVARPSRVRFRLLRVKRIHASSRAVQDACERCCRAEPRKRVPPNAPLAEKGAHPPAPLASPLRRPRLAQHAQHSQRDCRQPPLADGCAAASGEAAVVGYSPAAQPLQRVSGWRLSIRVSQRAPRPTQESNNTNTPGTLRKTRILSPPC